MSTMWLIPLVFIPFVLGIFSGMRVMKQKMILHMLEKMDIQEFDKLIEG